MSTSSAHAHGFHASALKHDFRKDRDLRGRVRVKVVDDIGILVAEFEDAIATAEVDRIERFSSSSG